MIIQNNKVVAIDYVLKNADGDILDDSKDTGPLEYIHGTNMLIKGLEKELDGKKAGDKFSAVIAPEDAYGAINNDLIFEVKKSQFPLDAQIEEGMQFEASAEDGSSHVVTVKKVDGDAITIDANHELAGVTLYFDVNVIDVRDATTEELEHGLYGHCCCGGGCGGNGCADDCNCDDGECAHGGCSGHGDGTCGGHHHDKDGCCGGHGKHAKGAQGKSGGCCSAF